MDITYLITVTAIFYLEIAELKKCKRFRELPTQLSPYEELYKYDHGQSVLVNNTFKEWRTAKLVCVFHFGGTLMMPKTKKQAKDLAEMLADSNMELDNLWIGLTKTGWIDGTPLLPESEIKKFFLVRPPEQDFGGERDCYSFTTFFHDEPQYIDLPCKALRGFICIK